uniref:Uncharacterized protein n=1 Tax=Pipistrellus kuhlii TaxID=59472 RepID=A0A7J7VN51_PIPKU|nr:hypothetical protein mPipKuh1_008442 [Pipistrellus kuhlii]
MGLCGKIPEERQKAETPESITLCAKDSLLTLMLDSPSGKEKKSSRLEECDEEQEPLPDTGQLGSSKELGDGAPRGRGVPPNLRLLSAGNGAKAEDCFLGSGADPGNRLKQCRSLQRTKGCHRPTC